MPNWCYTNYAFKGKGLDKFKNSILPILDEASRENGCNYFLGDLLDKYNISQDSEMIKGYGCRGWIYYYEDNDDWLSIDVEDAWCPHTEVFDAILTKFPDVDYVYLAEEPCEDIFINTDTSGDYFEIRYRVVVEVDDFRDEHYFKNIEEVNEYLKRVKKENNFEELVENEDYFIDEYDYN